MSEGLQMCCVTSPGRSPAHALANSDVLLSTNSKFRKTHKFSVNVDHQMYRQAHTLESETRVCCQYVILVETTGGLIGAQCLEGVTTSG